MTKKHFIAMAIEFGDLYRRADWKYADNAERYGSPDDSGHVAELDTIRRCEEAFMSVAKRANPRFDSDHFLTFVQEIRTHARDLDGRKVSRSKVSA